MLKFWRFIALTVCPIGAGILGGLAALALIFPTQLPSLDARSCATIAALLFAVFSLFYRFEMAEAQSRKQHTINILFNSRLSPEFRQHLEYRRIHFPEGERIDYKRFKDHLTAERTKETSGQDAKDMRKSAEAVRSLLNYYEFIALGIKNGDLDEDMMKGSIRGNMCNLVADAVGVIEGYQVNNRLTYEHVTELYQSWKTDDKPDITPPSEQPS